MQIASRKLCQAGHGLNVLSRIIICNCGLAKLCWLNLNYAILCHWTVWLTNIAVRDFFCECTQWTHGSVGVTELTPRAMVFLLIKIPRYMLHILFFLIIFLENELVKINLIFILALSPLGLERQWCVPSISMSRWQLLPFWKWNWICFENFAYICYFAIFSLYMTFKMLSFLQKFLKLILLLLGKNNSSNIANTASTTTNTLVNTAAGVEDLNIIQVTIPGVYTVWFHIILFVLIFFMTFV